MTKRREFIRNTALASAAVFGGFSTRTSASSYRKIIGASDKINMALVGVGNRGWDVMNEFDKSGMVNWVALCDVDMGAEHTKGAIGKYPGLPRFKDFRKMFDQAGNQFDAVVVATPDFSHFPICMMALRSGKHVFVEKPLARTFHESELLIRAAGKYPQLVTQMGNQGHSEANYFQFKAWHDAGVIKDVTAITAHMNSPRRWHGWDTNIAKYPGAELIPLTLDWDTWNMAQRYHEYNHVYHYGDWRAWYDFGVGALGDWAAHIIDTAHEFLDLGLPTEVTPLRLDGYNDYFFPQASTIEFKFPARGKMPPVTLTWYDGVNNLPPLPDGYGVSDLDPNIPPAAGKKIQPLKLNPGKIIYSKELTFKGGSHSSTLSIIPESKAKEMEKRLPDVPPSPSNHFENFLLACLGKEKTRSPFNIAGPLSQVLSLGVLTQRLNKSIKFDRQTKQITNDAFANAWLAGEPPRKGWEEFYKV